MQVTIYAEKHRGQDGYQGADLELPAGRFAVADAFHRAHLAVPDDPELEREVRELENKIRELKKQSYMLQKVLSDGDIGSAVFIGERNRIDTEVDAAYRRLQLLKEQKLYEQEIGQTEYLITVCRNRLSIIEEFDEECFGMIVDKIVAYPDKRLVFRLKNGLELEEHYGKGM